jgi:hypothetical protein
MPAKRKAKAKKGTMRGAARGSAPRGARAAMAVARSRQYGTADRAAALAELPSAVCESDAQLHAVIGVLTNTAEPIEVRLAALQTLAAAAFSVGAFEGCRGDYIASLRKVATDENPEMRQRALGLLAREKDGFAQKRLLEGLRSPDKALVPPEKALQLLGYDIHAEVYGLARDIVAQAPNADAKREALRLLAADPKSVALFEQVLSDKAQPADYRQIAASALQALRPEKLQQYAREIVLDGAENPEVQATCLAALQQFGDAPKIAADDKLLKGVDRLGKKASARMKASARSFLEKYGR